MAFTDDRNPWITLDRSPDLNDFSFPGDRVTAYHVRKAFPARAKAAGAEPNFVLDFGETPRSQVGYDVLSFRSGSGIAQPTTGIRNRFRCWGNKVFRPKS